MNPDKLLTLLMGRCWHEFRGPFNHPELYICDNCRKSEAEVGKNPSYSDPRHRDEFFTWLTRENYAMWEEFEKWALREYNELFIPAIEAFIPWLFFSSPSRPRDLMAEWLRLDSTIGDFGWEECPNFNPNPEDVNCLNWNESCFCKSSKVLSAWAKYAKEGE